MRTSIQKNSLWLQNGSTKRDYVLMFGIGLLAALAMPPVNLVPVLLVCFPMLYTILNKSLTTRQAAIKTWLFHFGYFTAGLYWIAWALLVDATNNWWALPFALFGLPALMSFYPAIAAVLWYRLAWRGTARIILLAVLLGISEWVRGWAFTGFPWNLWGYTWTAYLPMLQSVALIGMYGLTFLTILLALAPSFMMQRLQSRSAGAMTVFILLMFIALFAWGSGRLTHDPVQDSSTFVIRIVQPNIPQTAKWDPKIRDANEQKMWAHTIQESATPPYLVIWPETAMTQFTTEDVRRFESLLQGLLPTGTLLATGVLDVELDAKGNRRFFNRISVYDQTGSRLDAYEKAHLVPFGEYLPLQKYWPVKPVAFKEGQFTAGSGLRTVTINNIPSFSPLICYEVLFPGTTVDSKHRPQWILNVTNDAWYGYTSGPFQHLAISQTRAVEEGLPLVRAANTGVSVVIDPLGRILGELALGTEGVLDRPVPPALKPTVFARFGNTLFFGLLLIFGALGFFLQQSQARKVPHVR
jgi:apolipoprotein N-acyltransferase